MKAMTWTTFRDESSRDWNLPLATMNPEQIAVACLSSLWPNGSGAFFCTSLVKGLVRIVDHVQMAPIRSAAKTVSKVGDSFVISSTEPGEFDQFILDLGFTRIDDASWNHPYAGTRDFIASVETMTAAAKCLVGFAHDVEVLYVGEIE